MIHNLKNNNINNLLAFVILRSNDFPDFQNKNE